jgi:Xaa-Pro aminopeptidase
VRGHSSLKRRRDHPAPRLRSGHPSLVKEGIDRIQDYLSDNALDAFLVLTKINRQYLSGFTGSAGALLITKRDTKLFVDDRYLIRARKEADLKILPLDNLSTSPALWASSPRQPRRYRRGQGRRGLKIGIEDRVTLRELEWLKKTLKARFVTTKDIIENLRAVKTLQEIKYITKAQKIIDYIFNYVMNYVTKSMRKKKGLTESAVALEMERCAKKLGVDSMAFESIVASGPNAAAPHHRSGSRKIGNRNSLLLDFGVLVNGYHSDFTRTLFIGKPDKKQEKVYNTVLEAQTQAIKKIRSGVVASEVDAVARNYITQKKFGKYFTHNTGHGIGLETHELPNLSPQSEDVLHKSVVVTVEPGIYIENWGGVRIEDMVLVSENGAEVLSKSPKDLRSIII